MNNDYFDKHGQVTIQIGKSTENAPLFRGYLEKLGAEVYHNDLPPSFPPYLLHEIHYLNGDETYFQAQIPEQGVHFSLDNMLGIYLIHKAKLRDFSYVDLMGDHKPLPVFNWNGENHYHPNVWMTFLAVQIPALKLLFAPFLYLMSLISALRGRNATSTKLLWESRLWLLNLPNPFFWLDYSQLYTDYFTKFGEYKNNIDNPLIQLSRRRWETR